MTNFDRERLVEDLTRLLSARLWWALLPAKRALSLQGDKEVADLVSWAANGVADDIASMLDRYEL